MSNPVDKSSISAEKRRLMEQMLKKKRAVVSSTPVNQVIMPRKSDETPELSFAQQRLWFLDELTPGNAAYAFCNIVRLDGDLDVNSLKKSFDEIVQRHENLRTTFQVVEGTPTQIIADKKELPFPDTDISGLPENDKEAELQKIAIDEAKIPFDLSEGPLIRTRLVRITEDKHSVILTMHHIVYDGWSLAVLFSELKVLYESFIEKRGSGLKPLAIHYADFALWQRQELETDAMKRQFAYWKDKLSGQLPTLELPTDRKRPVNPTYNGAMAWFYLSKSLTQSLEALARREECTLFMVLLAAFNILVSRYSGEKDIIVGTPIANRNRWEIEGLIGFFINSLVMRTSLEGNPDFCEYLEQVKKNCSDAYANQDYPFEKLVEDLQVDRNVAQNPVFQTMFALQNTPPPPDNIAGVNMQIEEVDSGTAVFDITLSMYENPEGLNGYFEYSSELFDQSTIDNMINAFKCLLEDIAANPEKELAQLTLLDDSTYKKVVQDWNANKVVYPQDRCITELIDIVADTTPEAIAIATAKSQCTYDELRQRSNKLASSLVEKGVQPNDFVGLCLNRSLEMFISILGVMKAGAAYLPLDPGYPEDRIIFMMDDTGANLVIVNKDTENCLENNNCAVFDVDELTAVSPGEKVSLPEVTVKPDNLAYIIYTSGSTGRPKGVVVTHKNLVHSTTVRQAYYDNPVKSFLLMSSFSFDSSVAGIFWTLCDGGTLVLPAAGQERDIFEVAKLVNRYSVSHMLSLPSVYSLLLSSAPANEISSLNTICVAGEECPSSLVDKHFQILPSARLYNEYGPTEGTVWSTVYECRPEDTDKAISIGKPIANVQIYILDSSLSLQPIGVPGEVYIAGEGVTNGYLNRPELTDERFLPNPYTDGNNRVMYKSGDIARFRNDGNIEFLGRIDDQVKVRGYRIELGEIEDAILQHESVAHCAVVAQKNEMGDSRLAAYVETTTEDTAFLAASLANHLPSYMIPSVFIPMASLPLMPNGKVNRRALPEPEDVAIEKIAEFEEPGNSLEVLIAKIWAELLELEQISVIDNFFEIGGHSILATRVVSRIYESFDVQLPIRHVFDNPTVRGITDILLTHEQGEQVMETAELMIQIDGMSEDEIDALMSETIS